MIPTVLLDLPVSLALGQLFAIFSRRSLIQYDKFSTMNVQPLTFVMAYACFCFAPITGYYYYAHTAWSLSYLWNPVEVPILFGVMAVSGYIIMMMVGWISAAFWILRRNSVMAWVQLIWSLMVVVGVFKMTKHQYFHIGTYSEYLNGQALPLFHSGSFLVKTNILGVLLGGGAIITAIILWRVGKGHGSSVRLG